MADNNKHNIHYFEGPSMRKLHNTMDNWQKKNEKRFLSMSINKDDGLYCSITLTNPTEVIILDGSETGGVAVSKVEGVNHLATRQMKKCFPATARVLTPTGTSRIADIKRGDMVVSYRPDGTSTIRPVTRKLKHGNSSIFRVALDDGTNLRVTSNHTVLTSRGWLRINKLIKGDHLVQTDGIVSVVGVLLEQIPEPVYNIYTAGEHTFVVDGVVVHNFTILRMLRTWIHQWFIDPAHLSRQDSKLGLKAS
tara:strand:- start:392 stop:1141 length:750 start_codon:yes stop_codon:yes gene_type:complete